MFIVKRDQLFLFEVLSTMFHLPPSPTSIKLILSYTILAFLWFSLKIVSLSISVELFLLDRSPIHQKIFCVSTSHFFFRIREIKRQP